MTTPRVRAGAVGRRSYTDHRSARAEYRHVDYGGVNLPDNVVDWTGHEVTAALLFNF